MEGGNVTVIVLGLTTRSLFDRAAKKGEIVGDLKGGGSFKAQVSFGSGSQIRYRTEEGEEFVHCGSQQGPNNLLISLKKIT